MGFKGEDFGDGFDDEVDVGEIVHFRGCGKAGAGGGGIGLGNALFEDVFF